MTATREYYRQEPVLHITGGADFDFRIVISEVASTDLDGKITDLVRLGAFDLTNWTNFVGEMRSFDGTVSVRSTVALDGTGDEGAIRVWGTARDTWALQQAGLRSGRLTILGRAPNGRRYRIVPGRWNLSPGSTSPLTQS